MDISNRNVLNALILVSFRILLDIIYIFTILCFLLQLLNFLKKQTLIFFHKFCLKTKQSFKYPAKCTLVICLFHTYVGGMLSLLKV